MIVPVRPYRVKGGTTDVSLNVYPRMRKVVFFPPQFFFDYKNVVLFVLRAELPCLPACNLSQASCANILTLDLSLCLTLNSFCFKTKEPELQ